MILYGVASSELQEIIEFFLRRADAEEFLAECLTDEPRWVDVLSIEAVEFEFVLN